MKTLKCYKKPIYELLEGSGEPTLIIYNGQSYGLPCYTATELRNICRSFGMTELPDGSRWYYVEELVRFAISNNRCNELLNCFFALDRFMNWLDLQDMEIIEKFYSKIVGETIRKINSIIKLTHKELQFINGHFYIADVGKRTVISAPNIDVMTTAYVRGLRERCEADLLGGNLDSVVTKSRTLMEEVLVRILELNNVAPCTSGKIGELYNQVKNLRNMQQKMNLKKRLMGC